MKTFRLLSLGQRNVGKTLFLAGSYLESRRLSGRLECADERSRRDLESLLAYIERSGSYPPATLKVSDFHFRLRSEGQGAPRLICHFDWQDIPGELCEAFDPRFQAMILASHGCCLFLDAAAMANDPAYADTLANQLGQTLAITSLVAANQLPYALAVVFTKCDRLADGSDKLLDAALAPLTDHLRLMQIPWRSFRVQVPIAEGEPRLQPSGAVDALTWLASEVAAQHGVALGPRWLGWLLRLLNRAGRRNAPEPGVLGQVLDRPRPPVLPAGRS